jgi:hypothetical protein
MKHIPVKEILPNGTIRTFATPESIEEYKKLTGLDVELRYTDMSSDEVWEALTSLYEPKDKDDI